MNQQLRDEVLAKAKKFFEEEIVPKHIENTEKLKKLRAFKINPFLISYVANFFTGDSDPRSIARALVYPRALGISISTSFGQNTQKFCSNVLGGFGSTTHGIDIEFIDQLDGRKKYCQLKSGPSTINSGDVNTIIGNFKNIKSIARTNNVQLNIGDLIVGVMYGTPQELSYHYKKINEDYPVIIGKDFWHRLTGAEDYYHDLIRAIGEVALKIDGRKLLEEVVDELAKEIAKKLEL